MHSNLTAYIEALETNLHQFRALAAAIEAGDTLEAGRIASNLREGEYNTFGHGAGVDLPAGMPDLLRSLAAPYADHCEALAAAEEESVFPERRTPDLPLKVAAFLGNGDFLCP